MLWLIVIILAYFLFAFVSLGDKYLLKGAPESKTYTFYVGVFSSFALILIPFVGFSVPGFVEILFCFLAGILLMIGVFATYEGLERFEASRIIPAMGGFIPVFTLAFTYLFSRGQATLGIKEIVAFLFLVLGSILISYSPTKKLPFKSLEISAIAALFFSLGFILSKYVYLMLDFWTGFIWMRIGAIITGLLFLSAKSVRQEVFTKKSVFNVKTGAFFIFNQAVGAGAFVLQNWAIALAPLAFLSIVNALQGIQYLFLFIIIFLVSLKSPKILEEKISKKVIIQKGLAMLLIMLGLVILAL
ncbi:hypothetical protein KKC65_01730 [Patescibacteria group bacterium]|nr:hypothetical protein [Patescibacteria group bacterium]